MDDRINFEHTNITIRKEPEVISRLAVLAGKIAYYNFEWRYVALLMFSTVQAIGVETFMKQFGKCVIMKLGEFAPRHRYPVPHYVLFYERTSEIQHYIEWVIRVGYDNTGKFIIVCVSTDRSNCDESAVLKTCMNIFVMNVIFLRVGDDGINPVGFTYWPVRPDQCYDSTPVKLDLKWDSPNKSLFLDLYPDKLENLHHCQISVSAYEQHPFMYLQNVSHPGGLDGELLQIIMNALNATFKIVQPADHSWGYFKNNTWSGAVGEVYSGRAQIAMCSAPLSYQKFSNFQITAMYNSMDMVWVSPYPSEKPAWEKLLYPLRMYVRVAVFLVFMLIAVTNTALKTQLWSRVRRVLGIAPPRSNLLFGSWLIFLGMPTCKLPVNWTLLFIVYQWVWFCFVIRSVYQGTLIGSLKHPAYEEGFQKFEDILPANDPFGGSVTLREFYSEDREVYDRWSEISLNITYKMLDEMASGQSQFHLAWSRESLIEYLLYYNGTKKLMALPDKIVNSPSVMFLEKYSPLTRPINQVLIYLNEGGFTDRSYAHFIQQGNRFFQRKSTTPEPLRLSHFSAPAAVLIFGWITSLFFFIVEIWCDRYEKKMRLKIVEHDTYTKHNSGIEYG